MLNQITLSLPETIHIKLEALARKEGVPLSQYILNLLTRQVASDYRVRVVSAEEQEQDREAFAELRQRLGQASDVEVEQFLSEREPVEPEAELTAEIVARLQKKIERHRSNRAGGDL